MLLQFCPSAKSLGVGVDLHVCNRFTLFCVQNWAYEIFFTLFFKFFFLWIECSFKTFPIVRSTNVHVIMQRAVWCQVLWRHASSEIISLVVNVCFIHCVLGLRLGVCRFVERLCHRNHNCWTISALTSVYSHTCTEYCLEFPIVWFTFVRVHDLGLQVMLGGHGRFQIQSHILQCKQHGESTVILWNCKMLSFFWWLKIRGNSECTMVWFSFAAFGL